MEKQLQITDELKAPDYFDLKRKSIDWNSSVWFDLFPTPFLIKEVDLRLRQQFYCWSILRQFFSNSPNLLHYQQPSSVINHLKTWNSEHKGYDLGETGRLKWIIDLICDAISHGSDEIPEKQLLDFEEVRFGKSLDFGERIIFHHGKPIGTLREDPVGLPKNYVETIIVKTSSPCWKLGVLPVETKHRRIRC